MLRLLFLFLSGKEGNFNKYDDKTSDFLNIPYDYTSVMHYSKTAFMNGTEPTILTNIPDFIDVIGQRMDFSEYDIQKLSRLYNCCKCVKFPHVFVGFLIMQSSLFSFPTLLCI